MTFQESKMHIDDIQKLVSATTPGEAVNKVRAMVKGFSPNDPPDNSRHVLIDTPYGFFAACYTRGQWYSNCGDICNADVWRWWELPCNGKVE